MSRVRPLSMLCAAALAMACTDKKEPPVAPVNPIADSADQVMFGLHTRLTDQGVLRADLLADTAFFFDNNSRIEMRTVATTFFDAMGHQTSVLTSEQGTYNTARAQTEARRNVVVVTPDGKRLTTPLLHYAQATNEITSDSAFVLTEPNQVLHGVGFVSDPSMANIRVLKMLSGAGTFTLPGTGGGDSTAPALITPTPASSAAPPPTTTARAAAPAKVAPKTAPAATPPAKAAPGAASLATPPATAPLRRPRATRKAGPPPVPRTPS